MKKQFDIYSGKTCVGAADVVKDGLYYRIFCRCKLAKGEIYKIQVSSGSYDRCLGVCLPVGNYFEIDTRIPVKYLPEEQLHFCVISKDEEQTEACVPVSEDVPFAQLHRIVDARMIKKDRQVFISFLS